MISEFLDVLPGNGAEDLSRESIFCSVEEVLFCASLSRFGFLPRHMISNKGMYVYMDVRLALDNPSPFEALDCNWRELEKTSCHTVL